MVLSSAGATVVPELGFHGTVGPGEEVGVVNQSHTCGSLPKLCGKLCHTEAGRSEQGAHH